MIDERLLKIVESARLLLSICDGAMNRDKRGRLLSIKRK